MDYKEKDFSYFEYERSEMLHFIPDKAKKILEIGCGNGAFGKLVKTNRECEYWGIEPDKKAADIAAEGLDKVLAVHFDEASELPEYYFDCVVFNDVLEHLYDPWKTVRNCKKLLLDSGTIVASIPNFFYLPNLKELYRTREIRYKESGILDFTHLRFFTRKSIKTLFEENGYRISMMQGINACQPRLLFRPFFWLFKSRLEEVLYMQYGVRADKE